MYCSALNESGKITNNGAIKKKNTKKQKVKYVEKCLGKTEGPILSASDYMRSHSDQIRPYVKKSFYSLGTDGFGRSDTRENLRHFFEVDRFYIVLTAVRALAIEGVLEMSIANKVIKKYNIDSNKPSPITV